MVNEQRPPKAIEWTRVYGRRGFTWNPIKGCKHACEWRMPDGAIAECYAKTIASRVASHAYPKGFDHVSFDEKELSAPYRMSEPVGIFADSMSDLMGIGVQPEWIERVIQVMTDNPQHTFFILTKNPPRLKKFNWPANAWIGVSAPPTFMYGKELSLEQQQRWYITALETLGEIDVPVRWTSIEPLSFDVSPILERNFHNFEWAVIGAASNGKVNHQPDRKLFERAYKAMGGKATFLKGNIDRRLAHAVCKRWVEEFPMVTSDWRERRQRENVK